MICRNCLRAPSTARIISSTSTATRSIPRPQFRRFLSSTSCLTNATLTTTPTSDSKPSSNATPLTPPSPPAAAAPVEKSPKSLLVKSSIPAGQPLKGLNFLKNAQDPVALPDDEYPSWLWTLLDRQEKKNEEGGAGDLFSKSKRQRRLAAKRLRKEQALHPELLIPKVPIYEQTIDLPASDGSVAGAVKAADARNELNKAMRDKRRAGIKEKNFLKAMG